MYLLLLPPVLSKIIFAILTFVFVLPGQVVFSFINESVGTFIMSIGGFFLEENFLPVIYGSTIPTHYIIGLVILALVKLNPSNSN